MKKTLKECVYIWFLIGSVAFLSYGLVSALAGNILPPIIAMIYAPFALPLSNKILHWASL